MSGTTAPTTAPAISAELPAPRKETSRPASEPMPAPTTAIMSRFDTILFSHPEKGTDAFSEGKCVCPLFGIIKL